MKSQEESKKTRLLLDEIEELFENKRGK